MYIIYYTYASLVLNLRGQIEKIYIMSTATPGAAVLCRKLGGEADYYVNIIYCILFSSLIVGRPS